jgi:predicted transcriptional regulator
MSNTKNTEILQYIRQNPSSSSKEVHEGLGIEIAYATVKRALSSLKADNLILTEGKGKATKYRISPS